MDYLKDGFVRFNGRNEYGAKKKKNLAKGLDFEVNL
jgi:hypothetical protein